MFIYACISCHAMGCSIATECKCACEEWALAAGVGAGASVIRWHA
jgi:hypothetical protein